jgi:hypothetical protein
MEIEGIRARIAVGTEPDPPVFFNEDVFVTAGLWGAHDYD